MNARRRRGGLGAEPPFQKNSNAVCQSSIREVHPTKNMFLVSLFSEHGSGFQ